MFCVLPGKSPGPFTIVKEHILTNRAYRDDLSTYSICRNQADPERFPGCCGKRTKSHARFSVTVRSA